MAASRDNGEKGGKNSTKSILLGCCVIGLVTFDFSNVMTCLMNEISRHLPI